MKIPMSEFDKETRSVLEVGCSVAEEGAASRYGVHWRQEYSDSRTKERQRRFGLLDWIFPDSHFKPDKT